MFEAALAKPGPCLHRHAKTRLPAVTRTVSPSGEKVRDRTADGSCTVAMLADRETLQMRTRPSRHADANRSASAGL